VSELRRRTELGSDQVLRFLAFLDGFADPRPS